MLVANAVHTSPFPKIATTASRNKNNSEAQSEASRGRLVQVGATVVPVVELSVPFMIFIATVSTHLKLRASWVLDVSCKE